ncbi:MAG: nucleotide exchange factor GrpE [Gammaproteobacteria bacterium]|nr:nucleotide exchange factor GrpE [Gammaproteobacteria bacterium]
MKNDRPGDESKWQKIADDLKHSKPEFEELEAPTELPALDCPSREELENDLTKLEEKYNEAVKALRYSQAEMDNLRKRAERDVSNAYKYGAEKLIVDMLAVVDSIEKSLELMNNPTPELNTIQEGIALTYKLLMGSLEKLSVKQVNPVGEAFNPTWHEAMTLQEQPGTKPGTVLTVLQKGYLLHERLLRPALVIVTK